MMKFSISIFFTFSYTIGPLHDPVTWYKIAHAGEQVAQWDFQNNATRTSSTGPAFVLEVPLRNLLTSMCDFVPCDRIVQGAYSLAKLLSDSLLSDSLLLDSSINQSHANCSLNQPITFRVVVTCVRACVRFYVFGA